MTRSGKTRARPRASKTSNRNDGSLSDPQVAESPGVVERIENQTGGRSRRRKRLPVCVGGAAAIDVAAEDDELSRTNDVDPVSTAGARE